MVWNGDKKTWAEGCDKLITFFEKEIQRATKKNYENKAKKTKKWQDTIELYKTEDDVIMAYGYGMITAKERQDLIATIETGKEKINQLNSADAYIFLLKSFMRDLNQEKECLLDEK